MNHSLAIQYFFDSTGIDDRVVHMELRPMNHYFYHVIVVFLRLVSACKETSSSRKEYRLNRDCAAPQTCMAALYM